MRRTVLEDVEALRKAGWKWKEWALEELRRHSHYKPLWDVHKARRGDVPVFDLRWVLKGGRLTAGLLRRERYLLALVDAVGLAEAEYLTGIPRVELRSLLGEVREYIHRRRGGGDE